MVVSSQPAGPARGLVDPAHSRGLLDVWERRYLTRLLIAKEVRVRYQGSVLGLLWTYVKPLVRYLVYLAVFGYILGIGRQVENFPVYVFSGLVVVTLFNEALTSSTRSVRGNRGLVNRIYIPREMFPLVSVVVSVRHFLPQVVVLVVIAALNGWLPSWAALGYALAGVTLLFLFLVGLGLLFSTLNVFFRDAEQVVEIVTMIAFWSAPVMYPWTFLRDAIGEGWLLTAYLSNPLAVAVNLFHEAFWAPTVTDSIPLPDMAVPTTIAVVLVLLVLVAGQLTFTRLQGRFASEL